MTETTRNLKFQGFSTKGLAGDLSAGLTKSIDSVTGGMANAVLAGVNPVHGLYTVLAATPIGALFTSSVYMNIDSTGAIAATSDPAGIREGAAIDSNVIGLTGNPCVG